jgi:hypothetical protein
MKTSPKYYKGFTESIQKYQKSTKYKKYRRRYEANYRQEHRIMVNYLSWRSMVRPSPVQEIDYLLKRFLK